MPEDQKLIRVKIALHEGDKKTARELLRELLQEDDKPEYWLWMSTVVKSRQESIYCLKRVLNLSPGHPGATRGLIMMGELVPERVAPQPVPRINWVKELDDIRPPQEKTASFSSLVEGRKVVLYFGVVVIVLGLILSGAFFPGRKSLFSPRLTITPQTWTPSVSALDAGGATDTPEPRQLTPIGRVLKATYTPTPIYVRTPHQNYSTYQTALEAYRRGDYQAMLTYLETTADMLETPDIVFLKGEAFRLLERYQQALDAYERAIFLDEDFAPPYYGRALTKRAIDPKAEILDDLSRAIQLDERYGEAYLTRAEVYSERGEMGKVLSNAQAAVKYLPNSPRAHYYRALAYLETGRPQEAYRDGDIALEGDINHIPTYRLLGRIYLALENPESALAMFNKYAGYTEEETAEFDFLLGKAAYLAEEYQQAETALAEAIDKGRDNAETRLYLGSALFEGGDVDQGLGYLFQAWKLEPENYDLAYTLGRHYFRAGRNHIAITAFKVAEELASTPLQQAQVSYWRAQAYENTDQKGGAVRDWQTLVDLPEDVVPEGWRRLAEQQLVPTATPTQTLTPTITFTPTSSLTPTRTVSPTTSSQTPGPTSTSGGEMLTPEP